MPDLAALMARADRLLAAMLAGRAAPDTARELAQVLDELERLAAKVAQEGP